MNRVLGIVVATIVSVGVVGTAAPVPVAADPPICDLEIHSGVESIWGAPVGDHGEAISECASLDLTLVPDDSSATKPVTTTAWGGFVVRDLLPAVTYDVMLGSTLVADDVDVLAPGPTVCSPTGHGTVDCEAEVFDDLWDETTDELTGQRTDWDYVTTRDGTQLAVMVVLPDPAWRGSEHPLDEGPYPIAMTLGHNQQEAMPFGREADPFDQEDTDDDEEWGTWGFGPGSKLLVEAGYAFVGVQMRGSYCSGGAFRMFDDVWAHDGSDVIETMVRQPWADPDDTNDTDPADNGKVGIIGESGAGTTGLLVATAAPPGLGAVVSGGTGADYDLPFPGGIPSAAIASVGLMQEDQQAHHPVDIGSMTAEDMSNAPGGWANVVIGTKSSGTLLVPDHPPSSTGSITAHLDMPGLEVELTPEDRKTCGENQRIRSDVFNEEWAAPGLEFRDQFDDLVGRDLEDLMPAYKASSIQAPTIVFGGMQSDRATLDWVVPALLKESTSGRNPKIRAIVANGMHGENDSPAGLAAMLDLFLLHVRAPVKDASDLTGPELEELEPLEARERVLRGHDGRAPYGSLLRGMYWEPTGGGDLVLPPRHDWGDTAGEAREAYADHAEDTPVTVLWENGAGTGPIHPDTGGSPTPDDLNLAGGIPYPRFVTRHAAWPPTAVGTGTAYYLRGADGTLGGTASGATTFAYDPEIFGPEPTGGADAWRRHAFDWRPLPPKRHDNTPYAAVFDATFEGNRVLVGPAMAELQVRTESLSAPVDLQVLVSEVRSDGTELLIQSNWARTSSRTRWNPLANPLVQSPSYAAAAAHTSTGDLVEAKTIYVPIDSFAHVIRDSSTLRVTVMAPGGVKSAGLTEEVIANNPVSRDASGQSTSSIVLEEGSKIHLPLAEPGGGELAVTIPGPDPVCGALRYIPCRRSGPMPAPTITYDGAFAEVRWPQAWDADGATVAAGWNGGSVVMDATIGAEGEALLATSTRPYAVPAAPGQELSATAMVSGDPGTVARVQVGFRNAAGDLIAPPTDPCASGCTSLTSDDVALWDTDGGSVLDRPSAAQDGVVAPAGAVSAHVLVEVRGDPWSRVRVDDIQLFRGGTYAAVSPGSPQREEHNLLPMAQALDDDDAPGAGPVDEAWFRSWQTAFDQAPAGAHWIHAEPNVAGPDPQVVRVEPGEPGRIRLDGTHRWWVQVDRLDESLALVADPDLLDPLIGAVPTLPWGWAPDGVDLDVVTSPARTGSRSFRLTGTLAGASSGCGGSALPSGVRCLLPATDVPMPAHPGETHRVTFSLQATEAGREAAVALLWFDRTGNLVGWASTEGNGTGTVFAGVEPDDLDEDAWTTVTAEGIAPEGAVTTLVGIGVLGVGTGEEVFLDDYGVVVDTATGPDITLSSAVQAGAELTESGWEADPSVETEVAGSPTRDGGAALAANRIGSGIDDLTVAVSPRPAVVEGEPYRATTWVRAAVTGADATVTITWFDGSGVVVGSPETSTPTTDSTSDWTELTVTGTAPVGAVSAQVSVTFADLPVGEVHDVETTTFGFA